LLQIFGVAALPPGYSATGFVEPAKPEAQRRAISGQDNTAGDGSGYSSFAAFANLDQNYNGSSVKLVRKALWIFEAPEIAWRSRPDPALPFSYGLKFANGKPEVKIL
jgi:hypothetical protein